MVWRSICGFVLAMAIAERERCTKRENKQSGILKRYHVWVEEGRGCREVLVAECRSSLSRSESIFFSPSLSLSRSQPTTL